LLANSRGVAVERENERRNPLGVRFLEGESDEERSSFCRFSENEERVLTLPCQDPIVFGETVSGCVSGDEASKIETLQESIVLDDDRALEKAGRRFGEDDGRSRTGRSESEVGSRCRNELDRFQSFEEATDESAVLESVAQVDKKCLLLWPDQREPVIEGEAVALENEL
jgi:hypothetical protein